MTGRRYEIVERSVLYDGFLRLLALKLRHTTVAGPWTGIVRREVMERADGASVLLYDPDRDVVVLVEQFRAPAIDRDSGPWLLETVAGIVEPGENAAATARREAMEEVGLPVSAVIAVGETMPSPGGSSERVWLFCGCVDSTQAPATGGCLDHGEDIRVVRLPFDQALAGVGTTIIAAPAAISLQWLALNRDRVRAEWSVPASGGDE